MLVCLKDSVSVPNTLLYHDFVTAKDSVIRILREKYESSINEEYGYGIMVIDAEIKADSEEASSSAADDNNSSTVYREVTFIMLAFYPKLNEIVEGEVVEITDFGLFVRIGPTDALLHLRDITGFLEYDYLENFEIDVKNGIIRTPHSGKSLKLGSRIRARITTAYFGTWQTIGKIEITCKESSLGVLDWFN